MSYSIRTPSAGSSVIDDWCSRPIVNSAEEATPAILAALAGTGRAELRDGIYSIDPSLTTLIASGLIVGRGLRRTTLKLVAGSTGIGLRMASDSRAADFTVEGNGEANTYAISTVSGDAAANIVIDRVGMKNCQRGFTTNGQFRNVRLNACEIEGNTAYGILTTSTFSLLDVIGCLLKDNPEHIQFQSGPRGGVILGNDFEGGTTGFTPGTARDFYCAGNRFNVSGTPIATPTGRGFALGPNYNAAGTELDGAAIVAGQRSTYLGKFYGSAVPSAGVWQAGDFVQSRVAGDTQPMGWLCTTAGDFAGTPPVFAAQYRGRRMLAMYSGSWTPGGITAGSQATTQVTVTGSEAGDFVLASFSGNLPAGCSLDAQAIGSDLIDVQITATSNETIGAGTLRLVVIKP